MHQVEKLMRDGCEPKISTSDKQSYEKEQQTCTVNEEPPEESHTLNFIPPGNKGKFRIFDFDEKLKYKGIQNAFNGNCVL